MRFFSRFSRRNLPDRSESLPGYCTAPTKRRDLVRLIEDPVPVEAPIPGAWRRLPELPRAECVHPMVSLMRGCIGDALPGSLGILEACCADAQLALWGGRYLVVYTLASRHGEVEHFYGGNPCQPTWPAQDDEQYHSENIRPVRSLISELLKSFHEQIHDSLYSVSSRDGIRELKDVERFNDSDYMDSIESGMSLYERFRGHRVFHEDPSYGVPLLDVNGREPGRAIKCYTVSEVVSAPDFWDALDKDLVWSFMPDREWWPRQGPCAHGHETTSFGQNCCDPRDGGGGHVMSRPRRLEDDEDIRRRLLLFLAAIDGLPPREIADAFERIAADEYGTAAEATCSRLHKNNSRISSGESGNLTNLVLTLGLFEACLNRAIE